jgi:hypothetical protein
VASPVFSRYGARQRTCARWLKIEARSDPLLPFTFLFADDLHPFADRDLRSGKTRVTPYSEPHPEPWLAKLRVSLAPAREVLALHRRPATLLMAG